MLLGRIFIFAIAMLLLLGFQLLPAQPFTAEEPILITSAGQSSDVLMAKILAGKAGLKFEIDKKAKPEKVDSAKSVIIVSGGSVKGMGAAGIKKETEYNRIESLIKRAREKKLKIIGMHVGGKSRRGKLSDYFNQLVAANSDLLIVVKEGDEDGYFSKIAKERKIPIELVDKIIGIQNILKMIYTKK